MLKNIFILFFTILFTACSNISKHTLEDNDKVLLSKQLQEFKTHLKNGNIENVRPFFSENLKNDYVLNELETINFQNIDIFYSSPSFENDTATNTVALVSNGEAIYFEITYKFLNSKWIIIYIRQKGDK
ncbi:MAG: hypothetical protein KBE73_01285 [Fusobacteriaceae bacterium]|nr:hypothetical protein [Fusobacteriaceae bacterium]MBP6322287.1 hypothetical protein [Fusobacteriaceae bacterium]MBP9509761.1 hypothetical protein [Fusobacteriaceae bacterium]